MRLTSRPSLVRTVLGVAVAGGLALSLTACYSTSDSESNNTAPIHRENPELPESEATPLAVVPDLSGGVDTQVAVDESFTSALTLLGLTPAPVGDATFADGAFSFPITGGNVSYYDPEGEVRPYVQGDIQHDGSGISLSSGDTVVELTNFDIDPGASKLYGDVSVNGEPAAGHAYLFNLWGGTLEPLRTEGTDAVLEGTTVHVSSEAAELLNTTFETDLVPDELLVGVATITVATQ
ncbi:MULTISPECIES: hypothetical protein [Frigoribacterium]|uniref:hypothetical protein n=1 Tax=Frigoribacterium TaxID=96492 RepID=UPI0017870811|nr:MULTISPECIES: hypothetical protein [Frigoribacterium]MBD8702713.1 hypothetical protein [Frigoribacterium sp. CFBP 13712]MCJ0702171.1 hypothetical protein [Frigoribacterium faeni]MDY0893141.1 hypothetical protein [Frigoribacterium sp. CFBP9030]